METLPTKPEGAPEPVRVPEHVERPAEVRVSAVVSRSHTRFEGPLPPPDVLKGYEEASKGAAKRVLDMAERQAEHRQKLEWHVVQQDSRRADRGLLAGFVLCFTALVGGTIAICLGHDAAGATIATGSLIGLAGVFIYGTNARATERAAKLDKLTGRKADGAPPALPKSDPS